MDVVPESSEVGGAGECTDFGRWANSDQMGNESGDKDGGAHEELPAFIYHRMEKWRRPTWTTASTLKQERE